MKTIDAKMTLGELVDAHPQLARQFEQRGLDYCCGGRRSLADVCAERSLDTAAIVDELSATITDDARGEWSSMSAIQLVDHIESTHHRYLWEELPRLSALLDKVVSVHGERHPELNDQRTRNGTVDTVVRLWADGEPDLGDAARTRCRRSVVGATASADRRLHTAGRRMCVVHRVLRGPGHTGRRHAPPHPQGEQRAVPTRGAP